MNGILCADMDNTIIYSYKRNIGENKLNVELYNGREISFISEKTHDLLKKVSEKMTIIPTSTRTEEQYKRIDLDIGIVPYALVCNGGVLLVNGMDYVISGPVWEYYAGDSWKEGMIQEIREDRLCGFIGKTVIHPSQIPVVNRAYQISRNDYLDARAILNWNADSASLVAGSKTRERMNEYKTHLNWAKKTVYLSEVFGITE